MTAEPICLGTSGEAKTGFNLASFALLLAFLGPALSYKGFYLSHLCLPALMISILFRAFSDQRTDLFIGPVLIIVFTILYAVMQTAFITRSPNGWAHIAMIVLSFGTLTLGYAITRTYLSIEETQRSFLVFCVLLAALCICEFTVGLRLPDSRYSGLLATNNGNNPDDVTYYNVPTGFYGNQNNLALMIVLLLPFVELFRIRLLRTSLLIVLIVIILATDSRIAIISLLLIASIRTLGKLRIRGRLVAFALLTVFGAVLFAHLQALSFLCDGGGSKMCVIFNILRSGEGLDTIAGGSDSLGVRLQLTIQAWNLFLENPLFGIGPGMSSEYLSAIHFSAGEINVLHNPALEILVEYGIVGSVPWLIGWLMLLRSTSRMQAVRIRNAFTYTVFVIPVACLGVSTLYYFTPFWAALGMITGVSSRLSRPIF